MFRTRYFTVRVSTATDVQSVIARLQRALVATAENPPHASEKIAEDALLKLLTDIAARLQTELGNSATHGESRLSAPGVRIKVTTAAETQLERRLDALFKNRMTFV